MTFPKNNIPTIFFFLVLNINYALSRDTNHQSLKLS